jgi:hypothetical protein
MGFFVFWDGKEKLSQGTPDTSRRDYFLSHSPSNR